MHDPCASHKKSKQKNSTSEVEYSTQKSQHKGSINYDSSHSTAGILVLKKRLVC